MSKLSAIQVRNAKAKDKPYKLNDGKGLYLYISTTGLKSWRYRFKINKKESSVVLGEFPAMSLEQSRSARMEAREMVKAGKNPAHEKRKGKQEAIAAEEKERKTARNSFERVALDWIETQQGTWSKGHAVAVLKTLKNDVFPLLGANRVDAITPPMVLQVIRAIEKRGALGIAAKVLQRITAVFRYAVQTGLATSNPAAEMKGVLKTRKVEHQAALSREDLPEFLQKLTASDLHVTTRLALKFTILTAARTKETRGAHWREIDLENSLWKIPAVRMKMSSPHTVPLSRQAVAILERAGKLWGNTGIIFPGIRQSSKQLSENTLLFAMYRLGYHGRGTVHGFRATFSTITNESGFKPDVIEKSLAHQERNKVRAAYHRSEYVEHRRELMQWWADLLDQLEHGAEIIPFRAADR